MADDEEEGVEKKFRYHSDAIFFVFFSFQGVVQFRFILKQQELQVDEDASFEFPARCH